MRLSMASLLLVWPLGLLLTSHSSPRAPELEIYPKHFLLHPGEEIHYTACLAGSKPRCPEAEFAVTDDKIVRMGDPKGIFEAVTPGRTELVARIPTSERRVRITVAGPAQPPIVAVPYSTVKTIKAKEFLFVGHANRDGFDHTAVAKPGIDRLIERAKKNGLPVVYWVSEEYPDWYTADRHPDYAFISEAQEHDIYVDAQRVTFAGGSFMFCVLRNVQMTLHGMIEHGVQRIEFVFPAQALWVEDLWGPGEKRPYPAPMLLLTTLFARRADDAQAYDNVVVPFLDRMIKQFPVLGYPRNPPAPPLRDLLQDWSIVVRFGDRFERVYQRADSSKTLLIDFQGV